MDLFFRPTERSFADVAVNARRLVIRRATHLVNLDQPEAFTAGLRRFVRSITRPTTEPAARAVQTSIAGGRETPG
jgi:hypothetical protein